MARLRTWAYWPPAGGPGRKLLAPALVLAGALFVLGLLLIAWEYRADRQAVIDDTRAEAARAALEAERLITERINLLRAIASVPAFKQNDAAAGAEYLAALDAPAMGFGAGIAYLDAAGVMLSVTPLVGGQPDLPADLSDHPFVHPPLESGEPYVGSAFIGDFCPPILPLTVPVVDGQGDVRGLIAGFVLLEANPGNALMFTPGAPVVVVDRSGQIIVHDGTTMHPVDVSSEPLLTEMRAEGSGVRVDVTGLLGRTGRLVGFAELPAAEWMVVVTRPAGEAFAVALRPRVLQAGALVVALALALIVAGETARHLDRAAAGERRGLAAEQAARQAAQEALRTREQAIGEVTHDLRSPLTAIFGFARYLHRRSEGAATVDASLVRDRAIDIEEASMRMNALLQDLVDAARLDAGHDLVLNRQPGDLVGVLRETVAEEQQKTTAHEIRLDANRPIEGDWDGPRLRRVFGNLLSNAVKFSPEGGEILVTADMDLDEASTTISVHDRGIGVPAADLPHIFERFTRAGNAGAIGGTGLGLAGALHIVQLHGGTIQVESRPSEGSTFSVRLPVPSFPQPSDTSLTSIAGRVP